MDNSDAWAMPHRDELQSNNDLRVNIIDQSFKLVLEPQTVPELVEILNASAIATVTPTNGNLLLWVDTNLFGETQTAPSLCKPPVV